MECIVGMVERGSLGDGGMIVLVKKEVRGIVYSYQYLGLGVSQGEGTCVEDSARSDLGNRARRSLMSFVNILGVTYGIDGYE